MPSRTTIRWTKAALFALCLLPAARLVLETFGIAGMSLGANPIERLLDEFGIWGIYFLLITLAVSPLQRLLGKPWPVHFRRMLGLFAFFYVSMHFLTYAVLDQRLALGPILEDIAKRPFITIGLAVLLMLTPLAVTSTNGWMRRLGRRWKTLHRLVYPAAIGAIWHYWWQVKLDALQPAILATILAVLLGERLWRWRRKRVARARRQLRDAAEVREGARRQGA